MKKNIYIMMSHTNTIFGKLIRFFSNYPYNHVSISSNSTLQPLYSFARYNYNSPLVGGFVEESILRYLYYNKCTPIRVYRIEVSEEQFQKFQFLIDLYYRESQKYIYDTFGIFYYNIKSSKYHQTCLSFTVSILQDLQIIPVNTSYKTIEDLAQSLSSFSHTDTVLSNKHSTAYLWGNDKYYEKVPFVKKLKDTFLHFQKLLL